MVREFEELRWAKEVGPRDTRRPFFSRQVRFVFGLVLVVVSASSATTLMPQHRAMKVHEAALLEAEEREQKALEDLRRYELEASALKTDQRYLEDRARDVLFLQRPGEIVVQIN